MTAPLLLGFSVSGGSPPPTLESLRVFADGYARAIVAGAWPDGEPQDEAGLYERGWTRTGRTRPRDRRPAARGRRARLRSAPTRAAPRSSWAPTEPRSPGARSPRRPGGRAGRAALRTSSPRSAVIRSPPCGWRSRTADLLSRPPEVEPVAVSPVRPRVATYGSDGPPPLSVYHGRVIELDAVPDFYAGGRGSAAAIPIATSVAAPRDRVRDGDGGAARRRPARRLPRQPLR